MPVGNCWKDRWRRVTEVIRSVTLGTFRRLSLRAMVGTNEVPVMAAVILCYTCRRRISPEELAQGLHDHHGQENPAPAVQLASSDVIRPERTE